MNRPKFDNKEINFIHLDLLEGQTDIILRALELYAYNLEYMISESNESQKNKLMCLSSTYEQISQAYCNQKNITIRTYNINELYEEVTKIYSKTESDNDKKYHIS